MYKFKLVAVKDVTWSGSDILVVDTSPVDAPEPITFNRLGPTTLLKVDSGPSLVANLGQALHHLARLDTAGATWDYVGRASGNGVVPILGSGLLIGLIISLFQAVTQIQEQTLTFVPKIVVMILVAVVLLGWIAAR